MDVRYYQREETTKVDYFQDEEGSTEAQTKSINESKSKVKRANVSNRKKGQTPIHFEKDIRSFFSKEKVTSTPKENEVAYDCIM